MKFMNPAEACMLFSVVFFPIATLSAQEVFDPPSGTPLQLQNIPGVPSGALLTERGRELAFELKNLRRSRDAMGSRHPNRAVVDKRIGEVERLLKAWAPAEPEKNPFRSRDGQDHSGQSQLNESDLRQLVVQLMMKVQSLEARVAKLEARLSN